MNAVKQVLESIRHELNLHSQLPVINLTTAKQVKQYLERHSLQFCVLVVDGKTVKDAYENLPARKVEYVDLLRTAVERVGKKSVNSKCENEKSTFGFFVSSLHLIAELLRAKLTQRSTMGNKIW